MKKTSILIILFAILSSYCKAQSGNLFMEGNYNNFKHSLLKSYQQELMNELPETPMKINNNFRGNFGYTIGYTLNKKEIALFLG